MSALRPSRSRGFTLIELIIVVAIIVIVLTLAAPSFRESIARNRVEGLAGELNTDLQYARAEAVTRNAAVGVFFEATCYTIYVVGTSDATGCADGQQGAGAEQIKKVTIDSGSTASFTPSLIDAFIQFEPLRGMATNTAGTDFSGSVTVGTTVNSSWQLRADVTQFGRVKLCVPSGSSFTGYPSCV